MRIADYLSKKIIALAGGLSRYNGEEDEDRLILINDKRKLVEEKLKEYDVWYSGDSDEILNYYTIETNIEYNYEPMYSRNKRGYFWSISSTENDIKRTHSGQPRNIVDTMTSLIGEPEFYVGMKECPVLKSDEMLRTVLRRNEFWDMYTFEQMPMTMVEGWGAYKIDWDLDESDLPIIKYYRAKDVEYIYKDKRRTGIIFKDYYTDGKLHNYMITEIRTVQKRKLYVYKEVFLINGDDIQPLDASDILEIEELSHIDLEPIVIDNFDMLLAVPCVFYKDTVNNDGYGRSIYAGKIDLFDDLDQCLSQSSNTVRRSTAIEYFNTDFLERNEAGLPKQPKAYDRKYTMYTGGKNADGTETSNSPVQVTQPQLQFTEYSVEAQNILLEMISGIMSPATLGIDLAKKDNADAQREKEKITIFTRNVIIKSETRILRDLFNQILVAVQLMKTGIATNLDYLISIKFSEFADDSYENKLQKLGEAYVKGVLSTDMYLDKLYGDSLSSFEREREKKYLDEKFEEESDAAGGMPGLDELGGAVQGEEDSEFDFGDKKPGFSGVDEE